MVCADALHSKVQLGAHKCDHCNKRFAWPGKFKTEKIAQSARDRHIREVHNKKAKFALAARRHRQRKYQRTYRVADARACGSSGAVVQAQTLRIFVLTVARREAEHNMFSDTRDHLVRKGFPFETVRSLHGYDASSTNAEMRRNGVVMWGFQFKFIQHALQLFDEVPSLEFIFFAEDDARLKDGITAADLVNAARVAAPSACRLGWLNCGGHTDYGCQLTSFTREACEKFQEILRAMSSKASPLKHLMSLDIWWRNIRGQKLPSGHVLMKKSKKLLVTQCPHVLRGRK